MKKYPWTPKKQLLLASCFLGSVYVCCVYQGKKNIRNMSYRQVLSARLRFLYYTVNLNKL